MPLNDTPVVASATRSRDDWRILRMLSLGRVVLDTLMLVLLEAGYNGFLFGPVRTIEFHSVCIGYALAALGLLTLALWEKPSLQRQTFLQFSVDFCAILALMYSSGGIGGGIGVLLITPAVGCSMLLETPLALLMITLGSSSLFAEELFRQSPTFSSAEMSETGLLAMILLGTSAGANAVARRARRSEALARRVGSEVANLTELNQRIIENLQTGVVVVDDNDRLQLLNEAARRLLGADDSLRTGQLSIDFPSLGDLIEDWKANPMREAALITLANGTELIPRPMPLGQGGTTTLVLLDLASTVRAQAQQLKMAALGRLSAGVAHGIRNPLSAIHHAGQLLAESPQLGADDRRLLEMIDRHSVRIDRIVRDILSISRQDEITPTDIELASWLDRSIEQYGDGFPARRDRFDASGVPTDLLIEFDASHLQQALFNLWDNSFQHGGADVHIDLSGGWLGNGRQPYLDMHDNGIGISAELRDRVFEPFFTTHHNGSGLGLYLSRELCDYNRARLELIDDQGGARFRIIFTAPEDL